MSHIHPFATDQDCSLADCRVLLKREASYMRQGQPGRLVFEFRRCARCGMGFVNPTPAEDVLSCFYTSDYAYYQAAGDQPGTEAASWKYRIAKLRYLGLLAPSSVHRAASSLAALIERLTRKTVTFSLGVPLTLPKDARILDYGYGTGVWLQSMRLLGYSRLAGYDIASNVSRQDELAALGIQVLPPDAGVSGFASHFECIRLEHVFEHLANPLEVLRSLHRALSPEGLLVMTFPSIYPWLQIEDLETSPYLDYLQLPIHLAHHSSESCLRLLNAAGFEQIALRITAGERFITLLARKTKGEGR